MLFKVDKIKEQQNHATAGGGVVDASEHLPGSNKLIDIIHLVDHGKTIHWLSEGDWSMHQLLQKMLEKTGAADVFLSSYAFSELPARMIADFKRLGVIKSLYCVIDSRIDVRSASAHTLIQNTADRCKLTHTHAKVTVLKNDEWFLAIVGSANYTTNKRYEAGFISTDSGVASFHKNWISNELTKL